MPSFVVDDCGIVAMHRVLGGQPSVEIRNCSLLNEIVFLGTHKGQR